MIKNRVFSGFSGVRVKFFFIFCTKTENRVQKNFFFLGDFLKPRKNAILVHLVNVKILPSLSTIWHWPAHHGDPRSPARCYMNL